ncbi:fetuin-B-like [Pelmatolapia mariae]|uniref:fetuin-B-like n=1 Tax=Pelmatolapia mariae TaxID=158779 RepID=UPI002FE50C38
MKTCVLLSLLLALGCVTINGAPVEHGGMEPGSCEDASTKAAAELALTKINQDRKEGYIFSLHHLSNAHIQRHGGNGVVFYLTLDVVETDCSVLSKKDWKSCDIRPRENIKVYGQCKAAIFINKVHRVERLYKYSCVIRPGRVHEGCPGCPYLPRNNEEAEVQKTVTHSLEKFHNQSRPANRFTLLKISRATAQVVAGSIYRVEYTIQETTCPHSTEAVTAENCPPMDCEFAHKGFCKASLFQPLWGEGKVDVNCEIYESEASEREKQLHLLGVETEHTHDDTHSHSHLHEHEHSHGHRLGATPHKDPEGIVTVLPALGQPVTLPSFPDVPAGGPGVGVTLPLKPDPQIPGEMEPTIEPFPTSVSAQCPTKEGGDQDVGILFANDPMFKPAA